MLQQMHYILRLNLSLEWRKKQSYLAILLYVLSTTYLSFLVFNGSVTIETWNALFWVILLFAAVQSAFRSFEQEASRRFLLFYGLVRPQVLVLGKTLYNFLYLFAIGLFTFLVFNFMFGVSIKDPLAFVFLILLASAGFAGILTFTSALSAKAGNNPALPAILSLPLLYPQVLTLSRTSMRAVTGFDWEYNWPFLLVLLLLAGLSIALSYLLFAYLWRD
jgi:heme exporter protein B